jgi:heptosyltransferase-3
MRILILRPGAIGDTLLTLPVLLALKAQYSHTHVTLVSNPAVLPLAQAWNVADEIADYGNAQWSNLFSTAGICSPVVRGLLQQTDMAVCWLGDPDGIVKHNLLAAGVQQVIVAPGRPPEGMHIHIVEYLAQTVGIKLNRERLPRLPALPITNVSNLSPFTIAIHPGSGGARKCWPVSHFASVIEELWHCDIPVLLLAGPADAERLATLLHQLPAPTHTHLLNIVTDAPLLKVAELLQQCKGYLGNDSGITHLAALLNIPTLALFGPSNPEVWHPLGSSVRVLHKPLLEHIQVNEVMSTMETFFQNR